MTKLEQRAAHEVDSVLAHFASLELLGHFASEPVTQQKRTFLTFVLRNFATAEKWQAISALREVVAALETLGIDGWSDAPRLLYVCNAALAMEAV